MPFVPRNDKPRRRTPFFNCNGGIAILALSFFFWPPKQLIPNYFHSPFAMPLQEAAASRKMFFRNAIWYGCRKIGAIFTEAKNAYSFPLLAIIENGMIALGSYLLIHVTIMKQTSLNPLKIIHACADFKMIFYNAKKQKSLCLRL